MLASDAESAVTLQAITCRINANAGDVFRPWPVQLHRAFEVLTVTCHQRHVIFVVRDVRLICVYTSGRLPGTLLNVGFV